MLITHLENDWTKNSKFKYHYCCEKKHIFQLSRVITVADAILANQKTSKISREWSFFVKTAVPTVHKNRTRKIPSEHTCVVINTELSKPEWVCQTEKKKSAPRAYQSTVTRRFANRRFLPGIGIRVHVLDSRPCSYDTTDKVSIDWLTVTTKNFSNNYELRNWRRRRKTR